MNNLKLQDPTTLNLQHFTREAVDFEIREVDKEKRQMTIRASTINTVRGLAILPTAFDLTRYRKNPTILWMHQYYMPAIGKTLWIKPDEMGLLKRIQFAGTQFAMELFYLYSEEYMRGWSIGFDILNVIEKEDERFKDLVKKWKLKDPNAIATKVLLYETSAVTLGADMDALTEKLNHGQIHSELLSNAIKTRTIFSFPGTISFNNQNETETEEPEITDSDDPETTDAEEQETTDTEDTEPIENDIDGPEEITLETVHTILCDVQNTLQVIQEKFSEFEDNHELFLEKDKTKQSEPQPEDTPKRQVVEISAEEKNSMTIEVVRGEISRLKGHINQ